MATLKIETQRKFFVYSAEDLRNAVKAVKEDGLSVSLEEFQLSSHYSVFFCIISNFL